MKILRNIFSITNEKNKEIIYKVITILGFKIKFIKNPKQQVLEKLNRTIYINNELSRKASMINNVWQFNNTKVFVPNYPIDFIQKMIVNNNDYYEADVLLELDNYIPENSVILDLGANIGNHTLYWLISSKRNIQKVHSFEPVKTTFEILSKNIELNNLQSKAVLYNVGLFDKETKAEIFKYIIGNIGGTSLKEEQNGDIVLKRLDDIEFNEEHIDFMKIDVENLEFQLLNGAKNLIDKYKPMIFVESFNDYYKDINKFLIDRDYELIKEFPYSNYLYKHKTK
mgnify:CR=1 FL=1